MNSIIYLQVYKLFKWQFFEIKTQLLIFLLFLEFK